VRTRLSIASGRTQAEGAQRLLLSSDVVVFLAFRRFLHELRQLRPDSNPQPGVMRSFTRSLVGVNAFPPAVIALGTGGVMAACSLLRIKCKHSGLAVGAAMPLFVTALAPEASLSIFVSGTSLFFLALLGALAARAGGASVMPSAIRVSFWGALAMGITAGVGTLFGTVV
jgi:hypothetical protein